MEDIEIAHNNKINNIKTIAKKLHIENNIELYGKYKAKINYEDIKQNKNGKLILVTATSPTPYGEGKTTVSIGLADAMHKLDKSVCLALREPSMGPVFGLKGGATGGGMSQVVPMEDINLHFTGDFHAITSANNLLCAAIDNHLYQGNKLNINPETISFYRCMDMNDRALRNAEIGTSLKKEIKRMDHFQITAASEIMMIFCMSKDLKDLKERLNRILIGYTYDNKPVYAADLKVADAMSVLLKDALKPNLVQTLEHTPAIIHGGPFANIAHGCNSIIATNTALKLADYVITEAGFGSDLGAEKFLDIKCPIAGIKPSAIVLVTTIKALKYNGGIPKEEILKENIEGLKKGIPNLEIHINNLNQYHIPVIVCLNKFNTDTPNEIKLIKETCEKNNAEFVESLAYTKGGKGAVELANKIFDLKDTNEYKPLYDYNLPIKDKIELIAKNIYHSNNIEYTEKSLEQINNINKLKRNNLPICIAKTQYSISDDPASLGAPINNTIHVKEVRLYNGASFITVLLGSIVTMPGLPKEPAYEDIKLNNINEIEGIF